jgi:flagellar assembly protein FliH
MESPTQSDASRRIEVFQYLEGPGAQFLPAWEGWEPEEVGKVGAGTCNAPNSGASGSANETALRVDFEQRLVEETRKAFESGRERGRMEGRQAEREALAAGQTASEGQRVRQAATLIESFAQERDRFMHAVEHEVVTLALAVAARILRREAQMDPLLLTGAVRVALGQLAGSTQVLMRVPPAELDLWTEAMALLPNLTVKPKVVSGEGMLLGDCVIETELGSVDLGIRSQLGEIERGFFDRTGGRRAESSVPTDGAAGTGRRNVPAEATL